MAQSLVLGIGTGGCGLFPLARVLNQQPGVQVSYEEPPFLPWNGIVADHVLCERLARFRRVRSGQIVGDVASFYLPYVERLIALEPEIRIVCLRRPSEEVVANLCRWLDQTEALPTNHWAAQPAAGWHHNPQRTRIYPQYDTSDREEGIRRYWDEYYGRAEELSCRFPCNLRIYDSHQALNAEEGLRDLLTFVGVRPGLPA